jgi:hypothetical protein
LKNSVIKRLDHGSPAEKAKVAAIGGGRIFRILPGQLREIAPLPCQLQDLLGLDFLVGPGLGIIIFRDAKKDMAGAALFRGGIALDILPRIAP